MNGAATLADLQETAPHLRALVLLDAGGAPIASTLDEPGALASTVGELVDEAASLRPGSDRAVERLQVVTGEGAVFAVSNRTRTLAAVAGTDAPAELIFHDLRASLDALDTEDADARP
jgi:hypothetical protein